MSIEIENDWHDWQHHDELNKQDRLLIILMLLYENSLDLDQRHNAVIELSGALGLSKTFKRALEVNHG